MPDGTQSFGGSVYNEQTGGMGITAPQIKKSFVQTTKGKAGVDTSNQFSLVSEFKGYRNKEDITNLIPGIITVGSQNILSTTGGRFGVRQGYTLCGPAGTTGNPITSSYDWVRNLKNEEKHLRHIDGDQSLEMYYKAQGGEIWGTQTLTTGSVNWLKIQGIAGSTINFANFWNKTEQISQLLYVNGTPNIYAWSGATAILDSAGTSTLVIRGTDTWATKGFLTSGTTQLIIGTTTYTYTGGVSGTTLTGVTPSPSGLAGSTIVVQAPVAYPNVGGTTSIATTFKNDLIASLNNQIWIGSNSNLQVYISKVDSFTNYGYSTPRLVGEGELITLDGSPTAFIVQEEELYISAGKDFWYQSKFTMSSDNAKEDISVIPLKSLKGQAAQSQALLSKTKNKVFFVSYEPILDDFGRVTDNFFYPNTTNLSDPILNDFNSYDFTGGCCFYYRYFMYLAIPRSNVVRVYNMAKNYWEAPQIIPVQRFSIIDGKLIGHSSQTNESYNLFDGYNDNGQPIDAKAFFSYQNYGTRSNTKYFNEFYVEGYITENAQLNLGIQYEIDGNATTTAYTINGNDKQIVAIKNFQTSLGKKPLGKNPLGGYYSSDPQTGMPPKFRVIKVFPRTDFYEAQYAFQSYGLDYQWEILAFGPLVSATMYGNNALKQ